VLVAVALLAAYRLVEAPGTGRGVVLGAVVGLAALTRGEGLLLLPLLLLPVMRRPRAVRTAVIVCLAFVVTIGPWTARNWIVFDRSALVATEGGETLAGANCHASYYGGRIGTWQVSCFHVSSGSDPRHFNEAAALDEAGREGVRYARDHVDGSRWSRPPASVAPGGSAGPSRSPRVVRTGSCTSASGCAWSWSSSPSMGWWCCAVGGSASGSSPPHSSPRR
jgi:hypothetical protein